jgi:outer membrane immunogenic protein
MAVAQPALAADIPARMPVKAPVMAAPLVYNWTGFYIGGHVGYGWSDKDWTQTFSSLGLALDRGSHEADGFLGGGQIGFNYQVGQWVFGIEGDVSWSDLSGSGNHLVFPAYSGHSSIDWLATLTGRVGYAFDRTLLYVKGGVAFADDDHHIAFAGLGRVTNSTGDTRTGWTVGAGIEHAFWNNWSAKIEYNYMDFGSDNHTFTYFAAPAGLVERWDIDQTVHAVKFGINYRFGWGGPVVARY